MVERCTKMYSVVNIIGAHLHVKSSSGRVSPVDKQPMGRNGEVQVKSDTDLRAF